jgi:starvation-inducible DNA-binding protein
MNPSENHALGLPTEERQRTVAVLSALLADWHILYQNLHAMHWTVRGPHFFALHERYEAMYTRLAAEIDELAERILTLGSTPPHSVSAYLKLARLPELPTLTHERETAEAAYAQLGLLIAQIRAALDQVDPGTEDQLVGYLQHLEKDAWLLAAWLGRVDG